MNPPDAWDVGASLATQAGLINATPAKALSSLFVAPELLGGAMKNAMGLQVSPGLWRSVRSLDALVEAPEQDMQAVRELFSRSASRHPNEPCMGSRRILNVRVDAKGVEKYTLGDYAYTNFTDTLTTVTHFGKGLRALGVEPQMLVNFFADTCAEWQMAAQACFQHNIVVTTTYANLGEEAVAFAIQQGDMTTIFTDASLAAGILGSVLKKCPKVKQVIYIPDRRPATFAGTPSAEDIAISLGADIKAYSFYEVVEMGKAKQDEAEVQPPTEISRSDLCVVMYTSGSTAMPKGVLISNGNMLSVVAGSAGAIPGMGPGDRFAAYLPLAHILGMICEIGTLYYGGCVGYASPKTLSSAGVGIDPGTCEGDAPVLKPTLLAAVPMIFDKIRSAVLAKVSATGGFKAKLFMHALAAKVKAVERGNGAPFWDLLLFDKLRTQLLGGQVRYMLCGGGPLSRQTQLFMNAVFNCPVGQGMGSTETTGCAFTCWPNDREAFGRAGAPICCNQVRLEDWDEGQYYSKDLPNPRGELIVGGPNITQGYFKLPEETEKAYYVDADGMRWFRTGDIVEMWPNGTIQVVDRKKDLVKLSGGEYVSYGKLEPLVRESEFVDNGFVHANPMRTYAVVFVTLRPTLETIPTEQQVLDDITRIMKHTKGVVPFEIPKKIKIVTDAWTPESDLVTAALKLKRHNLEKKYHDDIARLYGAEV